MFDSLIIPGEYRSQTAAGSAGCCRSYCCSSPDENSYRLRANILVQTSTRAFALLHLASHETERARADISRAYELIVKITRTLVPRDLGDDRRRRQDERSIIHVDSRGTGLVISLDQRKPNLSCERGCSRRK